jgi:mannose-6-phosphate isomerase-like protein (cupin superfamily)
VGLSRYEVGAGLAVSDMGTARAFCEGKLGLSVSIDSGDNVQYRCADAPPGGGPRLHRHPYEEVFVVQEGTATFTAGEEVIKVRGGQVVVVPAGVPHKFVNSGAGRLRQIDIHASERFVTEWLED